MYLAALLGLRYFAPLILLVPALSVLEKCWSVVYTVQLRMSWCAE